MTATMIAYTDDMPQHIFFDDDGYNDEDAAKIDAYDGYDEWTDAQKEHEPLPMPAFNVYAYDFTTGKYETYASDYLSTSVRIHFECQRSWRKRVGNLVFFRDWWYAKALKESVEINRFLNPNVKLNAWGNPIPKTTYRQIISDSANSNWLDWIAQRDMGGY